MMTNYPILGVIGIALIYPVSASAQDALDEIAGNADHNKINNENQVDTSTELEQASTDPGERSTDDIAKELSNPNTPLASLTLKQIYTSFQGDLPGANNQSGMTTLFQPVFPFPISGDGTTNLFVRPALSYVERLPVFDPAKGKFKNRSGWADVGYDVAVGRSYDSGLIVVGGLQGTIPTNSDVSGGQWRLGPEFLVQKNFGSSYAAFFPQHQWDIAGDNYDYSRTTLELVGGVHLPNAWTVFTDSKWNYDWEDDQWTIPLNLTVSKVTKIGNLPVKFQVGVDYFAEANDAFGQDFAITFGIAPVVPNFIYNALSK